MSALSNSPVVAYCHYMEDLKARVSRIEKILAGHSPMKNEAWDTEIVCLFLRKCLELLAFSSLIAQRDVYAAIHADFSQHWNVKKLLHRIEAVNPDYYPQPAAIPVVETGRVRHLVNVSDAYLTKNDFITVYNFCSEIIHTRNPYRTDARVVQIERPIAEWVHRLKQLLDFHYVRLAGVQGYWVVQMNHPNDGKVHAFVCEPVG